MGLFCLLGEAGSLQATEPAKDRASRAMLWNERMVKMGWVGTVQYQRRDSSGRAYGLGIKDGTVQR